MVHCLGPKGRREVALADFITDAYTTVLAVQADQGEVLTVEGLATNGELHPIQKAFMDQHGLQCGYCTLGMQLAAYHLLAHNPHPSERDIRKAIAGNTCRCTGYQNIFRAIESAAELMER
ncbi:MAG: 2Fe-2S iron-sulfur cluster-binding protein [Terriglobales bacterium]